MMRSGFLFNGLQCFLWITPHIWGTHRHTHFLLLWMITYMRHMYLWWYWRKYGCINIQRYTRWNQFSTSWVQFSSSVCVCELLIIWGHPWESRGGGGGWGCLWFNFDGEKPPPPPLNPTQISQKLEDSCMCVALIHRTSLHTYMSFFKRDSWSFYPHRDA